MQSFTIRYIAKVGLLSAMAALLMFWEIPLPLMPPFLKLDISELPAIIAAFGLGPLAAVLVELLKNLIHLTSTKTFGIGEFANFLVGIALLLPTAHLYRRDRGYRGAVIALAAGTLSMILCASLLNYYVLLPLYQKVLNFPPEQIIRLGAMANPSITDLQTFITLAIAPFNAIKGVIISIATLVLYRRIIPLITEQNG